MKVLHLFALFFIGYALWAESPFINEEVENLKISSEKNTYDNFDSSSSLFENSPGMGGGMHRGGTGRGGFGGGSITRRGPYGGGGWFGGFVNPMNWPIYPGQPAPVATPAAPPSAPAQPDDPDIEEEKKKVLKLQYLLDQKKLLQQLRDLDKDGGASPPSSSPTP